MPNYVQAIDEAIEASARHANQPGLATVCEVRRSWQQREPHTYFVRFLRPGELHIEPEVDGLCLTPVRAFRAGGLVWVR